MFAKLLKPRPGFTLGEVIVALTMTAIIGAALTGVFATQMRFFEDQELRGSARTVSSSAMNVVLSELRMLEVDSALVAATPTKVTVRAPYAIGLSCAGPATAQPQFSIIPTDTVAMKSAGHTGYAYRDPATGRYTYVVSTRVAPSGHACPNAGVTVFPGGRVWRMSTAPDVSLPPLEVGTPVMLYHLVTYEFRNSAELSGSIALWRKLETTGAEEELVAPFDTTARFGFFVNDAAVPVATPPANLKQVTGVQLVLDGIAGPPHQRRAHRVATSVFFRNR